MRALFIILLSFCIVLINSCKSSPKEDVNTSDKIEVTEFNNEDRALNVDSAVIRIWDSLSIEPVEGTQFNTVDSTPIRRIPVLLDDTTLSRYIGDYKLLLDTNHVFTVRIENRYLYFISNQGLPVQFFAENDTTFFNHPLTIESLYFRKRGEYYNMVLLNRKGHRLEARRLPGE